MSKNQLQKNQAKTNIEINPGSFRDPEGYVVHVEGRVFRMMSVTAYETFKNIKKNELLKDLIESGMMVESSEPSSDDPLVQQVIESSSLPHVVEHRSLSPVTYPAEWSVSMLLDAALLTLAVQEKCLIKGYTLKDATSYNVVFDGCMPRFIDLTSIEKAEETSVWFALGQFYRMFLYPLLLKVYQDVDTKGYFLAHVDGLNASSVVQQFGWSRFFSPKIFFHVTLPSWLSNKSTGHSSDNKALPKGRLDVQLFQLRRMKKLVESCRSAIRYQSNWVTYTDTHTYTDESERQKIDFIKEFLAQHKPSSVLDLGCNTGQYSQLASLTGAQVVSVDNDHDALDSLYKEAAKSQHKNKITPVWMELVNPTPGMGLGNKERSSFLSRISGEAVFALALVHHLLVTARIPLASLVTMMSQLCEGHLVVEYVDTQDSMFRSLSAFKAELYKHITQESFVAAFSDVFDIVRELPLAGGTRVLFEMRKRH